MLQVRVILQHSCIHHIRNAHAVKLIKLFIAVKGQGNLLCTVAAEVEQNDHDVAVFDRTDRLVRLLR